MKLSLSVRVGEHYRDKKQSAISLEDLARIGAEEGYRALCMRASQIGIATNTDIVVQRRELLDDHELAVSMVTGDFPIPENSFEAPVALRNITPYLDLATSLKCDIVRVGLKREEDIIWAQRASDEAKERGIQLAQQCHAASLFERIDESLDVLRRIDRQNFGVTYEPANLEVCGEDYGPESIKRLSDHIINVYIQNQRLNNHGSDSIETWSQGEVKLDHIPISQPGGIDFLSIMETLNAIGYADYVTVHQAATGIETPEETIRNSARYLKSLLPFAG